MTDRDVLKRASEALRETTEPSDAELLKLRQRLLGGAQVVPLAHAKKRKALRWVLPLAAAFIAGSALAATPGAWEGMLRGVERFLDIELLVPAREAKLPQAKPTKGKPSGVKSEVAAQPAAEEAAQPADEPLVQEPAAVEEVVAAVPAGPTRTRTRTASVTNTSTSTSAGATDSAGAESTEGKAEEALPVGPKGPSEELTKYRAAHALHFGEKRYEEALRAWEAYLALPAPTFALEARYNRALCLLRLGHYEEARAALRPFAEGRVLGSYRRDEAQRLIQALDKRR